MDPVVEPSATTIGLLYPVMNKAHSRLMMMVVVVLQAQHEQSKLYFTYATECLTQALNLALANKHTVSGC